MFFLALFIACAPGMILGKGVDPAAGGPINNEIRSSTSQIAPQVSGSSDYYWSDWSWNGFSSTNSNIEIDLGQEYFNPDEQSLTWESLTWDDEEKQEQNKE